MYLSARWQAVVTVLALIPMLGCGALDATKRSDPSHGLVLSNPNLDFGSVVVGSRKVIGENILNATPSSVTISQVVVSGAGFHLDGSPFPLTLGSNQSASFSVTFTQRFFNAR